MGMNFDVYSFARLIEGGIPNQLELVENAITKLGSSLEPLTVYERFVFVANIENGEAWRLDYSIHEGHVRFSNPKRLEIESDSERFLREQQKITRSIVEALSENDQEEVDKLRANWMKSQRDQFRLEEKLNLRVGARSKYIKNARHAITEAVKTTRGAKSLIRKGQNKDLFTKLLKEGDILINPSLITKAEEPKSRQTLVYQKIVESRHAAMSLIDSPVFTEYLTNLYEDTDADEATEFIAENYQELYTLSIKEQTELFYNSLEKQGLQPDLEDVVECVLEIGRYAMGHPEISEQLKRLSAIVEAESGNFHERITLIEDEINRRHFTNNDISVLRSVIEKVLDQPSEFLAEEFLVELKKAYRRLGEMAENGTYDDATIAATIHLLSNFYPTQIGEAKKKESGGKEEYEKFFNSKLEKYGVSSPAELDDDQKKKFFDEIDKEWTGEEKGKKKEEEVYVDEDDPNAEKSIYNENEACRNCGSPKCLCQSLIEQDDMDVDTVRDEDGGDDSDTDAEQELAVDSLKKKFKEMSDDAKAEDWEELHKSVKAAKKKAKGKEMDDLEEMEDEIAMKKAKA